MININICPCDWGQAQRTDIRALLADTASHINQELRQPVTGTINVLSLPNQDNPQILFRQSGEGPYEVILTARDRLWSKFAYQFAHEFCHVLSGYDQLRDNPNNWFHESICELASIYTLRRMGERWRLQPPFSNWANYAPHLTAYASDIISASQLPTTSNSRFSEWLIAEEPALRKDPYQRGKNKIVACRLLGLFEEFPSGWNAITALPASTAMVRDYLIGWRDTASSADKPFVERITDRLTDA